jgi:FKBP-type peptidyl-prolyl cis-trans isomerase SlyD
MTNAQLTVADGIVVSLDYTLRLDDGEVVDSSEGREPLAFLQGQGHIIPGLEQALYGMGVGAEKDVVVAPADGYGEENPDAYELVQRDMFPAEMNLTPGMGLRLRDGNSGELLEAYVAEVRGDDVMLDFNHPLAGETLYFQVRVAGLRPATAEELAHGHVHDDEAEA